MSGLFRRSRATILVFLIASLILMGGGSSDPCLPEDPAFWWLLVALACEFDAPGSLDSLCDCLLSSGSSTVSRLQTDGPPMHFEWNLGQTDARYNFVSRAARGYSVYLSSSESVVELPTAAVRAKLAGAKPGLAGEPERPLSGRINYLLGADPSKWITDVPTFERVRYRNVYPGIDLVYYGNGTRIEHDFIVAPGSKADAIRFQFEGASSVVPNADGDLAITVGGRELLWKKPVLYQADDRGGRRSVQGRYQQFGDGSVGFEVGAHDPKRALVIDPEIQFASYLGGRNNEIGARVAVDTSGNVYTTGITNDSLFPITPGAFKAGPGLPDRSDVFISKFRSDGSSLVFSTYIGGQASDAAGSIAVDPAGNIYVAGVTRSPEFPTTAGAIQRQLANATANERLRADCSSSSTPPGARWCIRPCWAAGTSTRAPTWRWMRRATPTSPEQRHRPTSPSPKARSRR